MLTAMDDTPPRAAWIDRFVMHTRALGVREHDHPIARTDDGLRHRLQQALEGLLELRQTIQWSGFRRASVRRLPILCEGLR
jgi:hypothetical protein